MSIASGGGDAAALRRGGPEIAVRVYSLRAAREFYAQKTPPGPAAEARALLDTGASRSGVDMGIVQQLHLAFRDFAVIHTPAGRSRQSQYEIILHIPELGIWKELRVFGLHLAPQPHRVILGRDILSLGTLVYSGWRGGFEFCV